MRRLALPLALSLLAPGALAFETSGDAWVVERGPVEYRLHPDGSADIDDGSDLDAVRAAFDRWACAGAHSLRFREAPEPGARESNHDDPLNNVFWVESVPEALSFGMGPATLGITLSLKSQGRIETADIVFNGADHAWTTNDNPGELTDVESIAVHEVGHLLGLEHPCESCPEQSVMTPTYPGGNFRALRQDDIDGVESLYPDDGQSSCEGPFREGEFCACDADCVEGLVCHADPVSGGNTCTRTCSSENTNCPPAFACVLGAALGGNPAPGVCINVQGLPKPAAGTCTNDRECAEGICLVADAIGRTVCRVSCESAADCGDDYGCVEGACVLREVGIECPDGPPEGCGCSTSGDSSAPGLVLSLLAMLAGLWTRGRRPSAS